MATLFEIQTSTHVREIIALDCTNSLNELRLKGLKSYFVLAVRCHSHISILSLKFVFGNKKQDLPYRVLLELACLQLRIKSIVRDARSSATVLRCYYDWGCGDLQYNPTNVL